MSGRIEFSEYGGPEVLRWVEEPIAEPVRGQVRVRNELIGVNPIDWKMTEGHFRDALSLPGVPGRASSCTGRRPSALSRLPAFHLRVSLDTPWSTTWVLLTPTPRWS